MRSKDGELMRILGLTPADRPELWVHLCVHCEYSPLVVERITQLLGQPPETRYFCRQCGMDYTDVKANPHDRPNVWFGLDTADTLWGKQEDTNAFEFILPWWRKQRPRVRFTVEQTLGRVLVCRPLESVYAKLLLHPHPGPMFALAVHTALYETIPRD
jgi:hypothetical protein